MSYYLKLKRNGLKLLSITDHESVEAYYNIDKRLFSGKIIPGVELRTTYRGMTFELLGYGFDIDKMQKMIKQYNYMNAEDLDRYILSFAYNKYIDLGIKFPDNFLETYNPQIHKHVSKYIQSSIQQYPENNHFLASLPTGKSFFRYCMANPDNPLFIDLSSVFPTISEVIDLVKEANGFVSIPHIFEYKDMSEELLFYLLDNYNIDMIECYYSSFSQEQTNFLLDISKKYNKHISGGSDFHGTVRPRVSLGTGKDNNLNIPVEQIEKWSTLINY